MDDLTKNLTLAFAYHVSENLKDADQAQIFWALDRFYFDNKDLDEGSREQRYAATQACALELDARGIPLRNPTLPVEFPRPFPGARPTINL